MTQTERPEIGATVDAGGIKTNYLEAGTGHAVILIHGSGPGVTAYANWRLVIPDLSQEYRVIAPDMVGFGFTDRPDDVEYTLDAQSRCWCRTPPPRQVRLLTNPEAGASCAGGKRRSPVPDHDCAGHARVERAGIRIDPGLGERVRDVV